MALTLKRERFCEEYLIDLNGTQAAIRAGFSEKNAASIAYQMLQDPDVQARINRLKAERSARTKIDADWVLQKLASIAGANLHDFVRVTKDGEPYLDLTAVTREQMYALNEAMVEDYVDGRGDDARDIKRAKVRLADRLKALELLGKHINVQAFNEKSSLDITGDLAEQILRARNRAPADTPTDS